MSFHGIATGFAIGDMITGMTEGATVQAVVLDKAQDTDRLLLMTLPDGVAYEADGASVKDWTRAPAPEARWVEVYDVDGEAPFFAAYVPNIQAAIAVYRAFEARDGDFKVEIYTNLDGENAMLDGIGYFGSDG